MKISERAFHGHLEDLSKVLIRIGIVVFMFAILIFIFIPHVFGYILNQTSSDLPLQLITIRPAEILIVQLKLTFIGGLLLSTPVTIPLLWSYLKPALTRKERRAITIALIPSIFLFVTGCLFAYLVITPLVTHYLLQLSQTFGITTNWTISAYISLLISLTVAFGLAFELPVAIFILSWLGLVTPAGLARYRKHIIVALLIASALITPPDVISQLLLTLPLYLLFETSLLLLKLAHHPN
jgi:sec-independent protein translocase protein TatC